MVVAPGYYRGAMTEAVIESYFMEVRYSAFSVE